MMARIETLSAYRCTFSYLQRNNPLKEELQEKIKADIPPEYTFADFIEDFCKATSSFVCASQLDFSHHSPIAFPSFSCALRLFLSKAWA